MNHRTGLANLCTGDVLRVPVHPSGVVRATAEFNILKELCLPLRPLPKPLLQRAQVLILQLFTEGAQFRVFFGAVPLQKETIHFDVFDVV